jgi:hypothetical protein
VLHWRLAVPILLAGGDIVLAAIEPTLPLPAGTGAVVGIAASAGTAVVIALLVGLSWGAPSDRSAPPAPDAPPGRGASPRLAPADPAVRPSPTGGP